MEDWAEPRTLTLAEGATAAIRELNHLTRGPAAFTGPAELYRLVAELALLAGGLPQLVDQLDRWLQGELGAGRVRSDDRADPGPAVRGAAVDLAEAGAAAHDLTRVLAGAQQRLARLGWA